MIDKNSYNLKWLKNNESTNENALSGGETRKIIMSDVDPKLAREKRIWIPGQRHKNYDISTYIKLKSGQQFSVDFDCYQ